MSKIEIDQKMDRILAMLIQLFLPNKEVFNSREAGLYLGLSASYVCTLSRQGKFPSTRPNNGKRFYEKSVIYGWAVFTEREVSSPTTEAEKMSILNPGKN